MIEPERDFCLIHHDPENLCSIPCGECKQQAAVARAYGDQCRRAGAEALREAIKHEVAEWVADSDDRARLYKAIRSLPLPLAAEAASPAAGAIADIASERQRQMSHEGWTTEHDDQHDCGELALAAAAYAHWAGKGNEARSESPRPAFWPWSMLWWKPTTLRRDLVKAGALIVAEIERLDRAST